MIDWNGKLNKTNPPDPPPLCELSKHFEQLYATPENETTQELNYLISNIYIPELDDPIRIDETITAGKQMKKGGFDLPNKVIQPLINWYSDIVTILMNLLFGISHPAYLCLSLLCAIPKKGNLRLPQNYRGIQMMPLLAGWYDRILANRLTRWLYVSHEQSAFQKGKSTIFQLFTLRILIMICKRTNRTLYIAFFDIEKAFDKSLITEKTD